MRVSTGLSMGELIERNARLYGDRPAFVEGHRSLTHQAYLQRSLQLADAFYRVGARHQDRIAILSMNAIEYAEVYGACEVAGFITATLNFRLAAPELAYILGESRPKVLIFQAQYTAVIDGLRSRFPEVAAWVCIGDTPDWAVPYEAFLTSGEIGGPPLRATDDDIAHLIYTSGTTGRPKGCLLGHRESLCKAMYHATDMGITMEDRVLIVMPLFHVGARGVESGGQWKGAAIHLRGAFDADDFIRTVGAERITVGHLAPTMISSVLQSPLAETSDLSSLKAICYAAAPMPTPVLRRGLALLGDVFHQSYGQTEGAVTSLQRCQHKPEGDARDLRRLGSVGQPYPGVDVRIVDGEGNDQPTGEPGEIIYRGGSLFRGYWNDSVATANALKDGWMHSGDMGRFDEDGFLYIVDRLKDMIISGGENIYSREVEEAIVQHIAVAECAVIGVPDDYWGETVRAVVALKPDHIADETQLIEFCRTLIASYKKPKSIRFCDELPKINGKIDKAALRTRFGARDA